VIETIRRHFWDQRFIETDTPSLVVSPGMEPHIRPIKISGTSSFLPTSPEFAMKKLLAAGYSRIFQICKSYRDEPFSSTHNPEFTMLEWYRSHFSYEKIMDDVEELFVSLCQRIHEADTFSTPEYGYQDLRRPWARLTIEQCFRRFAEGLELSSVLDSAAIADACVELGVAEKSCLSDGSTEKPGAWDDFFFRIMLNRVEPGLKGMNRPVIVYQYPASQAALANVFADDRGLVWAKRSYSWAALK
jgi:lysyl-tRNA synthetase class 2